MNVFATLKTVFFGSKFQSNPVPADEHSPFLFVPAVHNRGFRVAGFLNVTSCFSHFC